MSATKARNSRKNGNLKSGIVLKAEEYGNCHVCRLLFRSHKIAEGYCPRCRPRFGVKTCGRCFKTKDMTCFEDDERFMDGKMHICIRCVHIQRKSGKLYA